MFIYYLFNIIIILKKNKFKMLSKRIKSFISKNLKQNKIKKCYSILEEFGPDKMLNLIRNGVKQSNFKNITTTSFNIGDMGAAGGQNSLFPIQKLIEEIRILGKEKKQAFPEHAIIFLNDLPDNDFNIPTKIFVNDNFFQENSENIFINVSGKSFYEQCFPEEFLHFTFCFESSHFLPKIPGIRTNIQEKNKEYNIYEWKNLAKDSWVNFLEMREKELVNNGLFLLKIPSTSFLKIYQEISEIKKEMYNEGILNKTDLINLELPLYFRTEYEIMNPFLKGKSNLNFEILDFISEEVDCPYYLKLLENHNIEEYIQKFESKINDDLKNFTVYNLMKNYNEKDTDKIYCEFLKRIGNKIRKNNHSINFHKSKFHWLFLKKNINN